MTTIHNSGIDIDFLNKQIKLEETDLLHCKLIKYVSKYVPLESIYFVGINRIRHFKPENMLSSRL